MAFRSWQGWLALSDQGPSDGGLQVFPLLKESTAFTILRPFASDVPRGSFCGVSFPSIPWRTDAGRVGTCSR